MNTADNDSPETIRDDLRKLLRCPLSEEFKTELEPISEKLYEEWGKICGKYEDTMTDGLIRHVSDPESLELSLTMETEFGDLLEYRRRITEWIQNAREEFSLATIAFRAKVADRKTYPKHYPPQKYSKKQVCSLSQKKTNPCYTLKSTRSICPRYFLPSMKSSMNVFSGKRLSGLLWIVSAPLVVQMGKKRIILPLI